MRSHYCGEVDEKLVGKTVTVSGWMHRRRDHGGVIFIDLRDREGLVQVVCNPEEATSFAIAERVRSEYVLTVTGVVQKRPEGSDNPELKSGAIEINSKVCLTVRMFFTALNYYYKSVNCFHTCSKRRFNIINKIIN